MQLLFVADPLDTFKTYKDSTFAMMREGAKRGYAIWACHPADLVWVRGAKVTALAAKRIALTGDAYDWFTVEETRDFVLAEANAILMRKDPPFDSEYFYATHLLGQAEREGAKVVNSPAALRDHPEKLSILEFPELITPTIVTRSEAAIRAFQAEHGDIILKPLDGMGGMGIFRVKADGLNLGAIIETLNKGGRETVMVQRFIPEIVKGDKRVLVIGGEVVPFCLARIPQGQEVRGNLAVGGKGVVQPITDRDREIAATVGPKLAARGLVLIGIDVIGDCMTELNVTSPTCFAEISAESGFDVAKMFIDALERAMEG